MATATDVKGKTEAPPEEPPQDEPKDKEPEEKPETATEQLDKLTPRYEAVSWTFTDGERTETYVQKPMSWVAKLRFYSLIGDTIDLAMRGEGGLTVDGIAAMSAPAGGPRGALLGALGMNRQEGIDAMISGFAKLARFVPDLLLDCYCLWLNVPEGDWEWVKTTMAQNEDDGGLSDDDGMVLVETFVDQNMKAIRDFFSQRAPDVWRRILDRLNLEQRPQSASSKPSRRSGRRIQRSR